MVNALSEIVTLMYGLDDVLVCDYDVLLEIRFPHFAKITLDRISMF